jgi:cation:H+ antiporter
MFLSLLMFLGGLALLVFGAEGLVKGACRIALSWGISRIVIGLTVVALGTSAPEIGISASSSLAGKGDVAVGNVIGSNIANVFLILGLSALASGMRAHRQVLRFDLPVLLGVTLLASILMLDGALGAIDAVVLVLALGVYLFIMIRNARKGSADVEEIDESLSLPKSWVYLIGGLALLVIGSQFFVQGAVEIAKALDVEELIIGLTIVAIGTSTPELATSVVAARRGQGDIAIGNVIGSNILNLMVALPVVGFLSPGAALIKPEVIAHDLPAMGAAALAVWSMLGRGWRISRLEGGFLVGLYALYITDLIIRSPGPAQFMVWLWYVGAPVVLVVVWLIRRNEPGETPEPMDQTPKQQE